MMVSAIQVADVSSVLDKATFKYIIIDSKNLVVI